MLGNRYSPVPRFEAHDVERKIHPVQILFYLLGVSLIIYSSWLMVNNANFLSTFMFIISIIVLIYIIGRFYGFLRINHDFIEITSDKLRFRSTPPFGMGWLPVSRELTFKQISKVDIIQITPFHDPTTEDMALDLALEDFSRLVIGNNLNEDQIIKVGLALKGSVAFSRTLTRILGGNEEKVGEQVKDIINFGKAIWKSVTGDENTRGENN